MTAPVTVFLSYKGAVGTTALTYHLAWMYADLGQTVLAADLDPQASLSSAFLDQDRLVDLWPEGRRHERTIYGAVEHLVRGLRDDAVAETHVEAVAEQVHLVVGDLALAKLEDELQQQGPPTPDSSDPSLRVLSAFWRLLQKSAEQVSADVVLVDIGSDLGAINRAVLIAADFVVVPIAPDFFSLQGLINLGPILREWGQRWREMPRSHLADDLALPSAGAETLGYVVLQHATSVNRPPSASELWGQRIPEVYSRYVADREPEGQVSLEEDPHCLGLMKHYPSLIPMGLEARKPIFHLKPADGAIGSHLAAVQDARRDFEKLAKTIECRQREICRP